MSNPITINKNTDMSVVKAWADQNVGAGQKILGRYDAQTGNTTLYVRPNSISLYDRLSGQHSQRKEAAKNVLSEIMGTLRDSALSKNLLPADYNRIKGVEGRISDRALHKGDNHSIGKSAIDSLAIQSRYVAGVLMNEQRPGIGPTIGALGNFTQQIQQTVNDLNDLAAKTKTEAQVVNDLATRLVNAFNQGNPTQQQTEGFYLSAGSDLRHGLTLALKTQIGGTQGESVARSDTTQQVLKKAYDLAASRLSPNSEVPNTATPIQVNSVTTQQPDIRLGALNYTPVRFLGEGAFGMVFEYRCTNPPVPNQDLRIAYKVTNQDVGDQTTESFGLEALTHKEMATGQPSNVVGFHGAIRNTDGRIGIAMELTTGVDAFQMAGKLKDLEQNNVLPPAVLLRIRLALADDSTQGLGQAKANKPMIYNDLKSPNILIGTDGRAKLTDPGNAVSGNTVRISENKTPDNPSWLSPEAAEYSDTFEKLTDVKTVPQKWSAERLKSELSKLNLGLSNDGTKDLMKTVGRLEGKVSADLMTLDQQTDIWSLGMSILDLFTGSKFMDTAFNYEVSNKLKEFRHTGGNFIPNFAASSGDQQVDALLNRIFHHDPAQRPTPDQIRQDPVFQNINKDAVDLRQLIGAIAKYDSTKPTANIDLQDITQRGQRMLPGNNQPQGGVNPQPQGGVNPQPQVGLNPQPQQPQVGQNNAPPNRQPPPLPQGGVNPQPQVGLNPQPQQPQVGQNNAPPNRQPPPLPQGRVNPQPQPQGGVNPQPQQPQVGQNNAPPNRQLPPLPGNGNRNN